MKKQEAKRQEMEKQEADSLIRFSVTIPAALLDEFDQRIGATGRENRSEAVRALVRKYIAEERWQGNRGEVYGTVTLVYDHHLPNLTRELTDVQHDHGKLILCATHVHVDHSTCLECIIMKGPSAKVQKFVEALGKIRGIKSLDTVITSGA